MCLSVFDFYFVCVCDFSYKMVMHILVTDKCYTAANCLSALVACQLAYKFQVCWVGLKLCFWSTFSDELLPLTPLWSTSHHAALVMLNANNMLWKKEFVLWCICCYDASIRWYFKAPSRFVLNNREVEMKFHSNRHKSILFCYFLGEVFLSLWSSHTCVGFIWISFN